MKKPLLSEMTLREKIGQCLLVYQWEIYDVDKLGFEADENKLKAVHEKEQFGVLYGDQIGVYFDKANFEKERPFGLDDNQPLKVASAAYKAFMEKQASYLKIPPLVATDSEQGAGYMISDLSKICRGASIGAADSEELAYELGVCIAKELRCAGMNWRWFPVADIGNRNGATTIRSLAMDDPQRSVRLANALIRGTQSQGVAATVKHFPGHDKNDARDSHFTATANSDDMDTWWSEQGKIFQEIIDDGVYSVMIGHQAFPACDDTMINGKYVPATLSKKIITDLLKGEMGFDGVVVTDGITMGALFSLLPYEELIVGLINAGNDVILGAKMPSGDILEKAVLDGRIPMSRIDDACQRVLDMKEKMGMFDDGYNDIPYQAEDVVPQTRKVNEEISRRSMTLIRDRHQLLPLKKENIKKVSVIVSSHSDSFIDELQVLKEALEARGMEVYMQRRLKSTAELKQISDNSDLIIYAAYVVGHVPKGAMRLVLEECETYYHAFTHGKEKSIGASFGYPYIHYDIMENADTFINTYNASPEAQKAFVEAVFGEIEIVGKSPVKIIPDANSR